MLRMGLTTGLQESCHLQLPFFSLGPFFHIHNQ